ncbi:MAG: DUF3800 domain-containing protein [Thermodesulfobacteriota bacterium]
MRDDCPALDEKRKKAASGFVCYAALLMWGGKYLCYLDESGTPDHTSNTSHFVLLGVAFHVKYWSATAKRVEEVKQTYGLSGTEIHTGWLARRYQAQESVAGFANLDWSNRRLRTEQEWQNIIRSGRVTMTEKAVRNEKKRYQKSRPYFHLSFEDRLNLLRDICDSLNAFGFVRIFAESINKTSCRTKTKHQIIEQTFMQVVTRFEYYLSVMTQTSGTHQYGILIQDNNDTVNGRIKEYMEYFHEFGTLYRNIDHIVETPFFVDSELTNMVQVADVCAYAFRRFHEKGETDLFDRIYSRIDRRGPTLVGARHYVQGGGCTCRLCLDHTT